MSKLLSASLLLAVVALPAHAVTRTWPGAAPCAATLQACIAASASGDRIEIVSNGPIDESISLFDKSIEVVAANGVRPQFANNRSVSISSSSLAGNLTSTVSGLQLRGGYVLATYQGVGTANYTISNMSLDATSVNGAFIDSEIRRGTSGVGTLNLMLDNNRVDCGQGFLGENAAIGVEAKAGATLNARLLHNRVSCSALGGIVNYGIRAKVGSPDAGIATVDLRLHGNEVRVVPFTGTPSGVASFSGIAIIEDGASLAASDISSRFYSNAVIGDGTSQSNNAMQFLVDNGDLNALVTNNTLVGFYQSLYAGSYNTPGSGPQVIDGPIRNNVMVSFGPAIYAQATTTSGLTNNYNLVNAPSVGSVSLGLNSVIAPARLVSPTNPRLRADSPAIDAADTASLALGIAFGGLPALDADGLRRIKGVSGDADIGAYEYGDVSFRHTTTGSNTSGHVSGINAASLNGLPAARLFSSGSVARPIGVYYQNSASLLRWALFDMAFVDMPIGSQFNLFVPDAGAGLFTHSASVAGSSFTQLDNSAVNNLPDRIVLVEQNWSLGTVYNPHPVGLFYGTGAERWYIDNLDGVDLPNGAGFNVYAQTASPNAFRITASAANSNGTRLRVDHPLLDGSSCAMPIATRLNNPGSVEYWRWEYISGLWYLASASLPIGTRFHVLVNPAQVADCRDRIFAHGFE